MGQVPAAFTSLSNNDIQLYNATTKRWNNAAPSALGILINIGELADVQAGPHSDNDFLRFESSSGEWESEPLDISYDTTPTLGGDLDATAASQITIADNNATALQIGSTGALNMIVADTSNGLEGLQFNANVRVDGTSFDLRANVSSVTQDVSWSMRENRAEALKFFAFATDFLTFDSTTGSEEVLFGVNVDFGGNTISNISAASLDDIVGGAGTGIAITAGADTIFGGDATVSVDISPETAEASPAATDIFLMERASDGALRKVEFQNISGAGGVQNPMVADLDGGSFDLFGLDQLSAEPTASISNPLYSMVFDEAGTNLHVNPEFGVNVTDGWSDLNGVTRSRDTTNQRFGAACLKCVTDGTTANEGTESATMAVSSSTAYVDSVWVKSDSGTVALTISLVGDVSGNTNKTATASTTWQRVPISKTTGGSDTTLKLQVRTTGTVATTFYVDGACLEQTTAGFPSSYFSGSFGQGYAWSGTAHNSTSTRAAGLHLIAPMNENTSNPFVVKPDGSLGAYKMKWVLEEGHQDDTFFNFEIVGTHTTQAALGVNEGIMRLENLGNGVALWVKSAVTTDFGILFEGADVTSGTIFGIAAPSDKSTMISSGGFYFKFLDKLGKDDFSWSPTTATMGTDKEVIKKQHIMYGGGRWAALQTGTGTVTVLSGTNGIAGTSTNFDPELQVGSLIVVQGEERVVASRTNDTTATIEGTWTTTRIGSGFSYADEQYLPPILWMENSGGDINAGDHTSQGVANFMTGFFMDADGDPRVFRGASADDVTFPANDAAADRVAVLKPYLDFEEAAAPGTPSSGFGRVYVKSSDSLLYYKDDGGTEYGLTAGAAGGATYIVSRFTGTDIRNATTTFADADDGTNTLEFAMDANADYEFTVRIRITATSATPDMKVQFTGPASPNAVSISIFKHEQVEDNHHINAFSQSSGRISLGATTASVVIFGFVSNGANAGDCTMQWAQSSNHGSDVTMQATSNIVATKVS